MKLYTDKIPDEGFEIDYEEPVDSFDYLKHEEKGPGGAVSSPVHVKLLAEKTSGGLTITGRLQGNVSVVCSRCLVETPLDVGHDFFYECLPLEAMKEKEELSRDSVDILYYYRGGEIDITALVQEQLVLALPMRPLCKEDCKGLCPGCGANLNKENCRCQKEHEDLRFEALRELKLRK